MQLTVGKHRALALTWPLALLPLAPIAVGLVLELASPLAGSPVGGDFAVLELHLRSVARLQHWLGPYSRFGWNHPGPLYYFVLLPLYELSGGSSVSLHISAGLITGMAAAGATLAFFRERTATFERVAFVAALSGFALDLFARRLPTNPWNPVVTVLPFAFYWVTCVQLASRRLSVLPLAVLIHAFLVQTHVSYLPCASALLAVGLLLALRQPKEHSGGAQSARWCVGAAVLLIAAWLPAVIAELQPGKSNVVALLDHFMGTKSRTNPVGFVLSYGSTHLHPLLSRVPGISDETRTTIALELVALQAVLLVVGGIVARSKKDRFASSACTLAGVGTVACFWSCRHIGAVAGQHEYLTHWFAVVGTFGWLAPALALADTVARFLASDRVRRLAFGVAAAGLAVGSAMATAEMWGRYRGTTASAARRLARTQKLTAQMDGVEALLRANPAHVLSVGEGRPWGDLAGVVLGLEKRGLAPILEQRWRFMFGGGRVYERRGGQTRALLLSNQRLHSASLIESFTPTSHLYIESPPVAFDASWALRPDGSSGVAGDTRLICDGATPPEGSRRFDRGSVRFNGTGAFLTVRLPEMVNSGVRVAGLRIAAEADDQYELSGSYDGEHFVSIGVLPAARGRGLRTRAFHFNDGRAWSMVRLSPAPGGHRHFIAEVSPIIEAGTRLDLDRGEHGVPLGGSERPAGVGGLVSANVHPTLWIPMHASAPARLTVRAGSATTQNSVALNVRVNGHLVGSLPFLGTSLIRSLVVPAALARANNQFDVELMAPVGVDPQAILHSIEVTDLGG